MTKSRVVDLEKGGVALGTFTFIEGYLFSVGDEVELNFKNGITFTAKVARIHPNPKFKAHEDVHFSRLQRG